MPLVVVVVVAAAVVVVVVVRRLPGSRAPRLVSSAPNGDCI